MDMEDKEHFFEEWNTIRELLNNYDERIHEIRKYGFSFVTALLAAQGILFNSTTIQDSIKFAVLLVTIVLIVALTSFERSYQLIQEAAAIRASYLEKILNLELTETISHQFEYKDVRKYELIVYVLLISGTLVLSFFTISFKYVGYSFMLLGLSLLFLYCIKKYLKPENVSRWDGVDWSIYPLNVKEGDIVKIILTNIDQKESKLIKPGVVWAIYTETGEFVDKGEINKLTIITSNDSITWLWDTMNSNHYGILRVYPFYPEVECPKEALPKNYPPKTNPIWRKITLCKKTTSLNADSTVST